MKPDEDGLPPRQRWQAVLALSLGVSVSVLVGSLVNVALPDMARALRASDSAVVWVVNAYQIAVTLSLLPLAALGERRGFRTVYVAGAALFALSSLLAMCAPGLAPLIICRVLQGVGAAGIMAVNTALLRACYPATQLGRGLGINGMVVAASAAAGPSVAAALLAWGSWPWLFGLQALVATASVLLAWHTVPQPDPSGPRLERRGPVLPVDLLRQPLIALALLAAIGAFIAQMAAQVALPFHLHRMLGWTPSQIGLLMTPWPLAVMCVAPVAGVLSDRLPAGLLGSAGLLLGALALLLLGFLPVDAGMADVAWRMALAGAGFALFSAPNVRSVVAATPPHRTGAAGGLIALARLLGQTLGASAVGWLLGSFRSLGTGGFTATRLALTLAAGVALAAAISSALRLRSAPG